MKKQILSRLSSVAREEETETPAWVMVEINMLAGSEVKNLSS